MLFKWEKNTDNLLPLWQIHKKWTGWIGLIGYIGLDWIGLDGQYGWNRQDVMNRPHGNNGLDRLDGQDRQNR